MASNEKYTILYGRLSQEDTQKTNKTDDSNSIQNHSSMRSSRNLPSPYPLRIFRAAQRDSSLRLKAALPFRKA